MTRKNKTKTLRMWISRDNYTDAYGRGDVKLHLYKPTLNEYDRWRDKTTYGHKCFLSKEDFPEVTFDNSPQEVEIKLVN